MRSAPTLNNWMMPFSSVAIIEKLALVRIAYCKAPALSSAFWWRTSAVVSTAPASWAMVGSSAILDMADFCEKCAAIRAGNGGQATEECDLAQSEKDAPLP